eukprot:Protomagalhaensia_wolfi_Nauph_80__4373@NODE_446_length_2513_cov_9_345190_g336_i0_p3_GENE_NODE_446_length_2513_cov_9_345190_g336_i0NODE_446_length_2513_cov_9_345190_g336_i0_p3_ORF_typecomplete_len146_score24_81PH_5/PF15405_6/0_029PH_5/PF15405_6/1_1e02PH_6/PF15406_6/0_035PH_6/PF15406_6/3_3e03PH/PF00169_29/0_045PH/PF00169_29/2_5e03CobT/PF06213_12/0_038Tim54/PF11711_8/0_056CCDC106/PF15794_5/0_89Secretin_N_2/PF07655_13/3_NODE_446_length_2513_cov_9_345190_g336_i010121449
MGFPIDNLVSASNCFQFKFLGHPQPLCASSSQARDEWMKALIENWFCLREGIQGSLILADQNQLATNAENQPDQGSESESDSESDSDASGQEDSASQQHGSNMPEQQSSSDSSKTSRMELDVWIRTDPQGKPLVSLDPPGNGAPL